MSLDKKSLDEGSLDGVVWMSLDNKSLDEKS